MKAVILAGGEGTRLRPLTLTLPKPVVPVVDRPFLRHQLDLLATRGRDRGRVLGRLPARSACRRVFGDGDSLGQAHPLRRRGDAARHRRRGARTPCPASTTRPSCSTATCSPTWTCPRSSDRHRATRARGDARADARPNPVGLRPGGDGRGRPRPALHREARTLADHDRHHQRRASTSWRPRTLDADAGGREPLDRARRSSPPCCARGDHVTAYVHRGYWIDIGTPEKYLQVHRDILGGPLPGAPRRPAPRAAAGSIPRREVDEGAVLAGALLRRAGLPGRAGARVGPDAVLTRGRAVGAGARVADRVLWDGHRGRREAPRARARSWARACASGAHAAVGPGAVLGEGTVGSADYLADAADARRSR